MRVSYQVTLKASGKQFTVQKDETLLEAALQQGITLPYGCKNGACGSCKGKVLEGQVEHGQHSAAALSPADEAAGGTLFCCAHPKSDLLIEAREVQGAGDIAIRKVPCRINSITKPSADVAILKLQLPAAERFQFLAGQYLEFLLKDGQRRAYSIANAPDQEGRDDDVEFNPGDVIEFNAPGGAQYAGVLQSINEEGAWFDFNHPLAGRPVTFEAEIDAIL
jgi:CDP-4-dehydro-6-deoxyglucose reductase